MSIARVPEIHKALHDLHVAIAPRTVTYLLERYEELLALRLADQPVSSTASRSKVTSSWRLMVCNPSKPRMCSGYCATRSRVRFCLPAASTVLARKIWPTCCARSKTALPVPIHAVVSDAQRPIRLAVQKVLPDVPHQLCQFHYLKEAAKPIIEADRHAKTELKKYTRGVREIERSIAARVTIRKPRRSEATVWQSAPHSRMMASLPCSLVDC